MTEKKPDAVWQGRLSAGLDPRARALNDSLPVDSRLVPEELALSRAYAATLAECGVMSEAECAALTAACDALEVDLGAGKATLAGEDVHSAVEAALAQRCGDPALRLHTGRSRNDQVATLLRMHVMRLCDTAVEGVRELERALVTQARESDDLACASYTHLQPAQPVRLAHWWLAHVEAFSRDEERFAEAREAADRLPLGAGAVAGTPLRYDRASLATRLGFSRVALNSLDAVGDRDFAVQYLQAAALLGIHLSRLSEDLVLFCSPAFGWFTAPDGFSTGSSLLPQKRNPDLFELARGKSARLLANAQQLATLLKGLPSSYQKDLQEDKEAVFDTADTLELLLAALPPAIDALVPNRDRVAASLTNDLLAVELADALVGEGVPFREAHRVVGALWAAAEQAKREPAALPLEKRLALSPHFTDVRLAALNVAAAIARRTHPPGAGSTEHQLAIAEARLGLGPGDDIDAPAPEELPAGRVRAAVAPTKPAPAAASESRVLADGLVLRRAGRRRARHRRRDGALCRRGLAAAAAGLRALPVRARVPRRGARLGERRFAHDRRVCSTPAPVARPGRGALARSAAGCARKGPRCGTRGRRGRRRSRARPAAHHRAHARGGLLPALRFQRPAARVDPAQGVDRLRALSQAPRL